MCVHRAKTFPRASPQNVSDAFCFDIPRVQFHNEIRAEIAVVPPLSDSECVAHFSPSDRVIANNRCSELTRHSFFAAFAYTALERPCSTVHCSLYGRERFRAFAPVLSVAVRLVLSLVQLDSQHVLEDSTPGVAARVCTV